MEKICKIISITMSPISIAAVITVVFSLFSPIGIGKMSAFQSILTGFIFLGIIPFLLILFFSKKYSIGIDIHDRTKRTPIFLSIILNYIIGMFIFWFFNNYIMFLLVFSYCMVAIIIMAINLFWKISVHTAGISGPLTALVLIFGVYFIPIFLVTIPIAYSRYKLEFHNKTQLLAGFFVPIFITYIIYFFMW